MSRLDENQASLLIFIFHRYKTALQSLFAKNNAHPVAFEVARVSGRGGHAHVQVVPVPRTISADAIADAFKAEGEHSRIDFEFEEADSEVPAHPGDRGYFRVELPDGRRMVHWLKDGVPFSIQFGRCVVILTLGNDAHSIISPRRQVLVSLLGIPDRFDWKDCAQSDADDTEDAQQFKSAFAPFDPCLE